jgi:hypothetical protein
MPEFSHPVFGSVGHAERSEVSVQQPSQIAQPSQASQEPPEEQPMVNSDLQAIIECGKITDTLEIDGQKFQMSTMTDEDQDIILKKCSSDDPGDFMELRRTVVAMVVETVNRKPFESLCPVNVETRAGAFEAKLAIVRKMQGQVVDRLYAFYDGLLKRSKQKIEPEQVKN